MTPIRRIMAIVTVGVLFGVVGGCDVTFTGGSSSDQSCKDRTLDLRQQPTRDEVGMEPESSGASWSCDEGYDLTVRLAANVSLDLKVREVSFSTYGADSDTADPSTVDVQSTWLSVDDAAELATAIADKLDMSLSQIDQWRRDAQDPPDDTLDTKTGFIRGAAGEVRAEMQVIHQSVSGNNNVHLILHLGPPPPALRK